MKKIKCYKVEAKGDTYNRFVGRFSTEQEAKKIEPIVGGYGMVLQEEIIIIYDTAIEYNPKLDEEAKKSGLAKLSEVEKKALGIIK